MAMTMKQARSAYEKAAKAICTAAAKEFPVGSRIVVTLGTSRIFGEIERVSDFWWDEPGTVIIRNEKTGNRRRFNASTSDIEAL